VTDVTGFGLAGHLLEMLGGTLQRDVIDARCAAGSWTRRPGGDGTRAIFSTMHAANRLALLPPAGVQRAAAAPASAELLYDPQTCGGLLMAVAPESRLRSGAVIAASAD
jgi:selenide,water dikinase